MIGSVYDAQSRITPLSLTGVQGVGGAFCRDTVSEPSARRSTFRAVEQRPSIAAVRIVFRYDTESAHCLGADGGDQGVDGGICPPCRFMGARRLLGIFITKNGALEFVNRILERLGRRVYGVRHQPGSLP